MNDFSCILGPCFSVYGAVLSDVAIVDPLSSFHLLWLDNNEKMMTAVLRTFRALRLSVSAHDVYTRFECITRLIFIRTKI